MKVLTINGQNHKGSTYHIGRILAEKITTPENIEEIFLPRDFDEFCCGCTKCFIEGADKCPHYAKLKSITEKIDAADVYILTSPVYVYHCTGQMKALLDHYGYRWMPHRPEKAMFRKQSVVITTAAGAGMKSACKDMDDSMFFWGIQRRFRYGLGIAATSWEEASEKKKAAIEKKTDSIAKKIKAYDGKMPYSFKSHFFFYIMRMFQKQELNKLDAEHWKKQGWMGKERPWK